MLIQRSSLVFDEKEASYAWDCKLWCWILTGWYRRVPQTLWRTWLSVCKWLTWTLCCLRACLHIRRRQYDTSPSSTCFMPIHLKICRFTLVCSFVVEKTCPGIEDYFSYDCHFLVYDIVQLLCCTTIVLYLRLPTSSLKTNETKQSQLLGQFN